MLWNGNECGRNQSNNNNDNNINTSTPNSDYESLKITGVCGIR
jgi:hypothetical protein